MLSNINKKSFEDDGNKTKEVIFLPFVIVLMIETVVVIVVFIWHQSAPMLLFDINQNRTDYDGNENNRSNQLSKAGTEASNL